ncbi:LysM peptidoglycan-binding domain-containing protein [Symbioplanes lichenis]|uniref:LysM peptidoglycan-binding domain-containing protein n=1 Tax=Symbioplanes lichenis TaxID=1629072 RepID=UPI002738F5EE|nr:LysM peptidoglycan-binding domain-containing protein [Actinoplanes lichenis]
MVATGVRPRPAPLRLTRRGRVVLLSLFLAAWCSASAVLWATASRADEVPRPGPSVVVHEGDSLWSIAERVAPGRPASEVVSDIERLNGLSDPLLRPGQSLVLPG